MSLLTPVLNAAVDAATALLVYGSIHSANPGGTGTSEIAGGSPAYARVAMSWDPATGAVATADAIDFNMPAGATAAYLGLWSAITGGTFRGSGALSASETFTGQGIYHLTATTVTGS